ncbi:hypothetical protein ACQP1W_31555 [Spirillospora sp. CA-255316]
MGGFGAASWGALPVVAAVVLAGALILYRSGRVRDALALGDGTAASRGRPLATGRPREWDRRRTEEVHSRGCGTACGELSILTL